MELPCEWLSRLSLNFVIKRPDTNKWLFDNCWVSRVGSRQGTQMSMFKLVGGILHHFTMGNNGVPMVSTAQDQHGSQRLLDRAFLGMLSTSTLRQALFFDKCTSKPTAGGRIMCWPYGTLWYKDLDVAL